MTDARLGLMLFNVILVRRNIRVIIIQMDILPVFAVVVLAATNFNTSLSTIVLCLVDGSLSCT
jgi:hypothetical protein